MASKPSDQTGSKPADKAADKPKADAASKPAEDKTSAPAAKKAAAPAAPAAKKAAAAKKEPASKKAAKDKKPAKVKKEKKKKAAKACDNLPKDGREEIVADRLNLFLHTNEAKADEKEVKAAVAAYLAGGIVAVARKQRVEVKGEGADSRIVDLKPAQLVSKKAYTCYESKYVAEFNAEYPSAAIFNVGADTFCRSYRQNS